MNPTLEKIEKEIEAKVSPENKEGYQRAVIAGMKLMFDPKTHANMELVKNPRAREQPVETVAAGVAGLMWTMFMQSKRKMPYEVMILAGTTLLAKVIDFAEQGLGIQFDNAMIAQATKLLAENMFRRMGITPQQLTEAIQKGKGEIDAQQGVPA